MTVLDNFFRGDVRALSKVISFIENRENGYRELLSKLYENVGYSLRVGITGPPGAGKSTLVNNLIHQFLKENKKVGVIAVDPTSPFTGGALLGDRVRMHEFPSNSGVYFRSMASRGALGGLSSATGNITVVLDAFGFDISLIETVGVGQAELDIIDTCDTVVVTIVPESGDVIQTMKAGLMEIADIFVVNKADRTGAEKVTMALKQTIETQKKKENLWEIPIIQTIAIDNKNIDLLFNKIKEHITFIKANNQFEQHRREQIRKKIWAILKTRFQKEFLDRLSIKVDFNEIVEQIYIGQANPYKVSEELFDKYSC